MMVLHDFLLKHIAPLQDHSHLTWPYTVVNDGMRLEHGDGLNLDDTMLVFILRKLSPDSTSHNFVTPPAPCQLLCLDQAVQMKLLVLMPSMDDIGIAMIQRGDQS
jgi:hypothetical protein